MSMPGFTAEGALSKSGDHYRESRDLSQLSVQKIVPQLCMTIGGNYCCFDPFEDYWSCATDPLLTI